MQVVVKMPRTKKMEISGHIPKWLFKELKKRYDLINTDEEEYIEITETDWYKNIRQQMTPGKAMRVYRENKGWSQSELGKKLGDISRQNISAMERGTRGISKRMAKQLAEILETSVDKFI